jgi:multiple sugar transport system permease protein
VAEQTTVRTAPVRPHPVVRPGRKRRKLTGYLFVAPFLLVFAAMLVVPFGYALYLSLYRSRLVGGTVFVGIANYTAAFTDSHLIAGVGRMLAFFLVQVPVMLLVAIGLALALDSGQLALARLIRLGSFLPYAVPSVVAALMWGYLYGPDFGPFAQLSRGLGLGTPHFLSSTWMLGSLANVVSWEYIGYNMIILYAALRTIPDEQFEAAALDGAGPWQIAWHVKLPAIRPAIVLTALFSVIGTFQLFNEPSVMRTIAPTVIGSDYTPNLYAFTLAFTNHDINYAAAVSFTVGLVIVVASYALILTADRTRRRG